MNQIKEQVKVGIADVAIAKSGQILSTSGLGSCVGVILYDEYLKIASMAHVMLPDSNMARQSHYKKGKFADTGIDVCLKLLTEEGSQINHIKVKMAGGAQMFKATSSNKLNIGMKNVSAIEEKLSQLNIPVVAKNVGGHNGRSIEFDLETSQLKIRTVYQGTQYI